MPDLRSLALGIADQAGISGMKLLGPAAARELPDWCKRLIKKHSIGLMEPLLRAKPRSNDDWQNIGFILGACRRMIDFFNHDMPDRFNSLDIQQSDSLAKIFDSSDARKPSLALLGLPDDAEISDSELAAQLLNRNLDALEQMIASWEAKSRKSSVQSAALYVRGFSDGYFGLINESGAFKRETIRQGIYELLLGYWQDIEALRDSNPRKTRKDLYEFLLSVAGDTPFGDHHWFYQICDEIKLKMKPLKSIRSV